MLTKRAFLGGVGALAALPAESSFGATGQGDGLRIVPAAVPLAPQGPATTLIRLDGLDQGRILRLALAERRDTRVTNALPDAVALEWRGLRGAGDLDRIPATIPPGATGVIAAAPADSGTALLRATVAAGQCAARGLQAVVVVPEPAPPAVDHDIVVHLQDWILAGDNTLRFGPAPPPDSSSAITVNGVARMQEIPVAPRARLRLRFVNGSVQRLMILACSGARPMIAAIDGQPSELFAPVRNLVPLGPGARYDLLLDAPETAGAEVRFSLKPTLTVAGKLEAERDLLKLTVDGVPLPAKPPLAPLPPNPRLPVAIPLETAVRADLTFEGRPGTQGGVPLAWSVNGRSADAKPVLTAKRGNAVVLGLFNASAALVPLRIGGHSVRLLHAKDDGWEPYWRDTVLLPPNGRSHVAFLADTPGLWAIDSGFDDYTLGGLSCRFAVKPG